MAGSIPDMVPHLLVASQLTDKQLDRIAAELEEAAEGQPPISATQRASVGELLRITAFCHSRGCGQRSGAEDFSRSSPALVGLAGAGDIGRARLVGVRAT